MNPSVRWNSRGSLNADSSPPVDSHDYYTHPVVDRCGDHHGDHHGDLLCSLKILTKTREDATGMFTTRFSRVMLFMK